MPGINRICHSINEIKMMVDSSSAAIGSDRLSQVGCALSAAGRS